LQFRTIDQLGIWLLTGKSYEDQKSNTYNENFRKKFPDRQSYEHLWMPINNPIVQTALSELCDFSIPYCINCGMRYQSSKKFITCEGCVTVRYCCRTCMEQDKEKHNDVCNLLDQWKKGTLNVASLKLEDEQKLNQFFVGWSC